MFPINRSIGLLRDSFYNLRRLALIRYLHPLSCNLFSSKWSSNITEKQGCYIVPVALAQNQSNFTPNFIKSWVRIHLYIEIVQCILQASFSCNPSHGMWSNRTMTKDGYHWFRSDLAFEYELTEKVDVLLVLLFEVDIHPASH